MSIEVNNITKIYGTQKALNNVSFHVNSGEIVGFLGPNGAGKSTMMKILTGYLPQNEGSAKVNGFDINKESMEVRRSIGYLPENNPLYGEMYIKEYLRFVAGMHGIKSGLDVLVNKMIDITGLGVEQHKKIQDISKGYKQRVGLAQALIHDPKVLILDEPTTGLDPNQLIDIRNLIIEIGKEKTVMLSTHIMQEVQAVCQRVIIVNKGEIVTDDRVENLQLRAEEEFHFFEVEFDQLVEAAELAEIEGVIDAVHAGNNVWQIKAAKNNDIRQDLFKWAVAKNKAVLMMKKAETSLEEVFQRVTNNKNK